ncbi:MAG: GNAT family N-acetyltransferase [Gemmatimonadota bacterium]
MDTALFKARTDTVLGRAPLSHRSYEIITLPTDQAEKLDSIHFRLGLKRVLVQCFPEQFCPPDATHQLEQVVGGDVDTIYVAYDPTNHEYVGAGMLQLKSFNKTGVVWTRAHVHWLAVRQSYRRAGIGKALVAHMAARAKQLDHHYIFAYSNTVTPGIRRFSAALGFREIT